MVRSSCETLVPRWQCGDSRQAMRCWCKWQHSRWLPGLGLVQVPSSPEPRIDLLSRVTSQGEACGLRLRVKDTRDISQFGIPSRPEVETGAGGWGGRHFTYDLPLWGEDAGSLGSSPLLASHSSLTQLALAILRVASPAPPTCQFPRPAPGVAQHVSLPSVMPAIRRGRGTLTVTPGWWVSWRVVGSIVDTEG